jgi:hypothetical protein
MTDKTERMTEQELIEFRASVLMALRVVPDDPAIKELHEIYQKFVAERAALTAAEQEIERLKAYPPKLAETLLRFP